MQKLAISDFDGTMYIYDDEEKNIPAINIEGIHKWQNNKHIFAFCTGRNTKSMLLEINRNKIPYDYLICNSGAIILDNQEHTLFQKTIPKNTLKKLITNLELEHCIEIMVSTKDKIDALILNKNTSNLIKYIQKEQYRKYNLVNLCNTTEDFNLNGVLQFTLSMKDTKATYDYVAKLKKLFKNELQINYNLTFIDICAANINKVEGINKLLELINKDIAKIITIGDAQNDVEMLKKYNGYSLDHATEDAKAVVEKTFPTVGDMLLYELNK